jgi:hypothetical protein
MRKAMYWSAAVYGSQKWKVRKVEADAVRSDDADFVGRAVEAWEHDGNSKSLVLEVVMVHHHT